MIKRIADVLALGGAIGGSGLIAANVGLNAVGYVLFLLSSVSSLYLLKTTKNAPKSLILQNLFFVMVNLVGLVRYGA